MQNCGLTESGHQPSLGPHVERPLERRLHLGCCQSVSALFVLSKVRQGGQA